jgi:hypothetical protein
MNGLRGNIQFNGTEQRATSGRDMVDSGDGFARHQKNQTLIKIIWLGDLRNPGGEK